MPTRPLAKLRGIRRLGFPEQNLRASWLLGASTELLECKYCSPVMLVEHQILHPNVYEYDLTSCSELHVVVHLKADSTENHLLYE